MRIDRDKNVITKEQIKKLQQIIKTQGLYDPKDFRNVVIPLEDACSTVHSSIFEILDLALQTLAVRSQNEVIMLPQEQPIETPAEKRRRNMNKPIDWWITKEFGTCGACDAALPPPDTVAHQCTTDANPLQNLSIFKAIRL